MSVPCFCTGDGCSLLCPTCAALRVAEEQRRERDRPPYHSLMPMTPNDCLRDVPPADRESLFAFIRTPGLYWREWRYIKK